MTSVRRIVLVARRNLSHFSKMSQDNEAKAFQAVTSFRFGYPCDFLLNHIRSEVSKASTEVFADEKAAAAFGYGPEWGESDFRKNLALFLSRRYNDKVNSSNLLITCGATQGFFMTCNRLFPSGSTIFVENPCYFMMLKMFRTDLNLNIVPVDVDNEGLVPEDFANKLAQNKDKLLKTPQTSYSTLLYFMTSFLNPKGISFNPERIEKLSQLAEEYKCLLFTDDVYNLLVYNPQVNSETKQRLHFGNNHLSNGSFSKYLAPGVRLGWMELPDNLVPVFKDSGHLSSGGCMNQMTSFIANHMILNGQMDDMVDFLRKIYSQRMDVVVNCLRHYLPGCVKFEVPKGGYFVWLEFPPDFDADKFNEYLQTKFNLGFLSGAECSHDGSNKNCVRLAITRYNAEQLAHMTKLFGLSAQEYMGFAPQI